ncbi:ABC1 family protein [Besnoitia besnoiti]|uniref:ABC1 family protein n=1 Tax=Besnoitia besnoiti TaxID=94643 RepID=A0A2A9MLX9_BESBE|nr:ABC1 family protein [Besnoitia besnoiti]PFH38294.1 ABC1 family protein [Besnoitia besnoiti]
MEQWNRKWRTLWCWSNVYVGWKVSQARARALPQEEQAQFWAQRHEHFANVIWENIKELRGWWVKVGQFMSTRSDLLPQQYIHHLVKLQDMMPTSDFASIKKTITSELGCADAIFERIEPEALASASIGQVHRAWLKDGSPVVVKVQHADVETLLSHDMQNLRQLSWAFGLLESGLNFAPILEEWQKAAAKELDFRYELAHQLRAYEGVRRSGIGVKIPKPYPEFTSKKVLVMEFVNGFKITDTEKLDHYQVDRRELMFKLCDSFAYQIHIDGLFNGDPHPGNILVEVNEETGEATPIILDWGLVKEFDSKGQLAFSKLVYAVASMNVMGLMEAFEDMGFKFKEGAGAVIDPEIYMDALRIALRDGEVEKDKTDALKQSAGQTLGAAQKAGLTRKKIQEKNPLEDWPKDIIFFVRVASMLHGLCVQLNVNLPFLQIMVKRAQECLFERYVPPSPLVYVQLLGKPYRKPHSQLEVRVHRLLRGLFNRGLLLGCQVAVIKEGALLVDACIGKMGPVDARPVTSDSLFCGFCVSKGLLTTALLKLVSDGEVQLDDLVSNWWDGFIRYGKKNITIRELLSHRAGLHRALPVDLTLSKLTNYETMVRLIEDAPPATDSGVEGRYAYLTYGWAVSELVASVACIPVETFVKEKLLRPYDLENCIFLPLPEEETQPAAAASDGAKGTTTDAARLPKDVRPEGAETQKDRPAASSASASDASSPLVGPSPFASFAPPSSASSSAAHSQRASVEEPRVKDAATRVLSASALSALSSFTRTLADGKQILTEKLGHRFLHSRRGEASAACSALKGDAAAELRSDSDDGEKKNSVPEEATDSHRDAETAPRAPEAAAERAGEGAAGRRPSEDLGGATKGTETESQGGDQEARDARVSEETSTLHNSQADAVTNKREEDGEKTRPGALEPLTPPPVVSPLSPPSSEFGERGRQERLDGQDSGPSDQAGEHTRLSSASETAAGEQKTREGPTGDAGERQPSCTASRCANDTRDGDGRAEGSADVAAVEEAGAQGARGREEGEEGAGRGDNISVILHAPDSPDGRPHRGGRRRSSFVLVGTAGDVSLSRDEGDEEGRSSGQGAQHAQDVNAFGRHAREAAAGGAASKGSHDASRAQTEKIKSIESLGEGGEPSEGREDTLPLASFEDAQEEPLGLELAEQAVDPSDEASPRESEKLRGAKLTTSSQSSSPSNRAPGADARALPVGGEASSPNSAGAQETEARAPAGDSPSAGDEGGRSPSSPPGGPPTPAGCTRRRLVLLTPPPPLGHHLHLLPLSLLPLLLQRRLLLRSLARVFLRRCAE